MLPRELVAKLRSMTETIKMLSTENVALREENDGLVMMRATNSGWILLSNDFSEHNEDDFKFARVFPGNIPHSESYFASYFRIYNKYFSKFSNIRDICTFQKSEYTT